MIIDGVSKEWGDNDRKIGDVIFRKLDLKRNAIDNAIERREPCGAIGQAWILGTLASYLKGRGDIDW